MRLLCCDGPAARLTVFTAFVFAAAVYLLHASTLDFGSFTTSSPPDLDSWAYVHVVEPESPHWPYRVFKSSPWTPPNVTITRNEGELAPGYLLLTAKSRGKPVELEQSAPWILTDDNELVYAHNASHGSNNLRLQEYEGKPHLTVWLGDSTIGHGYGELVILDEGYDQVNAGFDASIKMNGAKTKEAPGLIDFHEQELTSRGSVYVSVYNNTPVDLTPVGGVTDGWLADSLVYEFDIKTGEVLFTWSALDHIPLEASNIDMVTYMGEGIGGSPWDHFHLNSVQELPGDKLLINSRHAFAFYLVDKKTGDIDWELSGRGEGGNFGPLGEDGMFSWQHHARAVNVTEDGMVVSLFDNHHMQELKRTTPTRGLLLELSLPPDKNQPPKVLRNIHVQDEPIHSGSQGSYVPYLTNGNQMICYGPTPVVREFGPDGDVRWEGRFGHDEKAQSYRAFKEEWHARPKAWDPSLFVAKVEEGKRHEHEGEGEHKADGEQWELHVSWNGATDVDRWNVYSRKGHGQWSRAGSAKKKGFETVMRIEAEEGMCVVVGAVEGREEVRRSNEVCR